MVVSALLSVYWPVFMALSLFFAVWTAKGPVPFSECRHSSGAVSSAVLVAGSIPRRGSSYFLCFLNLLTVPSFLVFQDGYLFSRTSGEACLK